MHALLKDEFRRKLGEVDIDLSQRPTRLRPAGMQRDLFLQWDGVLDDSGQLRTCLACGCHDLYAEKAFPQVTGFVVVLAFTGAALGLLGQNIPLPVLVGMTVVLIADVAILVFSKRRLVCYRCRSVYRDLPIARYHRSWDRSIAERYPPPTREQLVDAAAVDDEAQQPPRQSGNKNDGDNAGPRGTIETQRQRGYATQRAEAETGRSNTRSERSATGPGRYDETNLWRAAPQ